MLVHLNGWAGVGKLSIAQILAQKLNGRVLDNHTIFNVAFRLTEFRSPEFYDTVRSVRDVAFARVLQLEATIPVILTNALGATSEWGEENWAEVRRVAKMRHSMLLAVTLRCSKDENLRRALTPARAYLGKLTDPDQLEKMFERLLLVPEGADAALDLDTTNMTPCTAAADILGWLTRVTAHEK